MYKIKLDKILEMSRTFKDTGVAEEISLYGLNDDVKTVAKHLAAVLKSNINYVLSSMFTVFGQCLGKNVQAIHGAYSNKANLYMMLVGDSGDSKSPTIDMVTKHVKKIDQKHTEEFEKVYSDAVQKDKKILPQFERQMVAENCTIEKLYSILDSTKNNSSTGVLLHLDEATYFFKPGAALSNKNGELVPHIMTMFAAPFLKVDRIYLQGKSLSIPNPMLSILTGTQYENLGGIFNGFRGSGFSSRFLFSLPSQIVKREELDENIVKLWNELVERAITLNELQLNFSNSEQMNEIEDAFTKAKKEFSQYDKELGAYVIKQNYYIYRIATIIHCINALIEGYEPSSVITEYEVECAYVMCLHFIANAEASFEIMNDLNPTKLSGKEILRIFNEKWNVTNFSALAEATGGKLDRAYASKCVNSKL